MPPRRLDEVRPLHPQRWRHDLDTGGVRRPSILGSAVSDAVVGPRDVDATAFTEILQSFLGSIPRARAVSVVDSEGETVDYAGDLDPFAVRVGGAQLQILARALSWPCSSEWGSETHSFASYTLPEQYVLVVLADADAAFRISQRAKSGCIRALAEEAGWQRPAQSVWNRVEIATDDHGRPISMEKASTPLEIVGRVVGAATEDEAFQLRTPNGAERLCVRERDGHWYVETDGFGANHLDP